MAKQQEKHLSLNKVNTRKFNTHFHASLRPKEAHKSKRSDRTTSIQTEQCLTVLCFTIVDCAQVTPE